MQCGFATCGRGGALRFMFAKQTHHTSFASASYRRSRCFVKFSKPLISWAFRAFRGKKQPSFTIAPFLEAFGQICLTQINRRWLIFIFLMCRKTFLNRIADVLFRLYNYNATTKEVYMQKHRKEENLWKKHRSFWNITSSV